MNPGWVFTRKTLTRGHCISLTIWEGSGCAAFVEADCSHLGQLVCLTAGFFSRAGRRAAAGESSTFHIFQRAWILQFRLEQSLHWFLYFGRFTNWILDIIFKHIGQVITGQSQDMAAKVRSSRELWSVKKKDTIFKIDAPNRISVELTLIVPRWFDAEHQFWKLWPCLFFLTDHNFGDKLTFAAISWLWAVITCPIIILTPMCHTYSESWVRALSHGPILIKFFFTKFSRRSERSKKCQFLHFLRASPRNILPG